MINRILVPVDFSKASLEGLDYAIDFGRPFKTEVVLLHVVEPFYFGGPDGMYGVGFDASVVHGELKRAARQQLSRLAATLRSRHVAVRPLMAVGTASQVIVDTAAKLRADLIIMATHGRTGLSHIVIGSVAERVVRSAPCPVLTVRPTKTAARPVVSAPGRKSPPIARPIRRRSRRAAGAARRAPAETR